MSLSRHAPTDTSEESLTNNDVKDEAMTGKAEEMPFLVTHWLANYGAASTVVGTKNVEQQEALDRIRKATSEIASAFESLGAYGTAIQVSDTVILFLLTRNDDQTYNFLSFVIIVAISWIILSSTVCTEKCEIF